VFTQGQHAGPLLLLLMPMCDDICKDGGGGGGGGGSGLGGGPGGDSGGGGDAGVEALSCDGRCVRSLTTEQCAMFGYIRRAHELGWGVVVAPPQRSEGAGHWAKQGVRGEVEERGSPRSSSLRQRGLARLWKSLIAP
jgi:hypothetical protein